MSCQEINCLQILAYNPAVASPLTEKASKVKAAEMQEAREIAELLKKSLEALNSPVAGLAAPQIGISKAIFVYSYDRTLKHLRACVNPRFEPASETKVGSWEACLSTRTLLKVAKISRYEHIIAHYTDPKTGKHEVVLLTGFAARVFQHEYDHLQGILNIKHPSRDLEIKEFASMEALNEFMIAVRAKDSVSYNPPLPVAQKKHLARL